MTEILFDTFLLLFVVIDPVGLAPMFVGLTPGESAANRRRIAVRGTVPSRAWRQAPALANHKLFSRDRQVCAYCGGRFDFDDLTREHIVPTSRGGLDSWMNCITACRPCNGHKGNRMP